MSKRGIGLKKSLQKFVVVSMDGQTYLSHGDAISLCNYLTCIHALSEKSFTPILVGTQSSQIEPHSDSDTRHFLRRFPNGSLVPNGQVSQEEWFEFHNEVLEVSSEHTFRLWEENIGETEYTDTTVSLTKSEIAVSSECVVTQPYESYPKPSRTLETWTVQGVLFPSMFKFLEVKDLGSLIEKLDGANLGAEIRKIKTFAAENSVLKKVYKYNHETDVQVSLNSINSKTEINLSSVYSAGKFTRKLVVTVQYKKEISELEKAEIIERGGLDREAETWTIENELLPDLLMILGVADWDGLKMKLEGIETETELSEIKMFAKNKSVFRSFQKFIRARTSEKHI